MSLPETTSAEALERYVGGKCLIAGRGEAWREVKAAVFAMPSPTGAVSVPSVHEPLLQWNTSGELETHYREPNGPWTKSLIKKHSFFLTMAGAPYECRWRTLTPEPFQCMLVSIGLPLLQRALDEVFGADARHARLEDTSGFMDATLESLMGLLRGELRRKKASRVFVEAIAQAIAIHLARHYATTAPDLTTGSASLPGYKLRQVTEWMGGHYAEEFDLERLAARVGLSKFHFHRLFKKATDVSPARYQLRLRMDAAQRLLRETKRSVLAVALEVGYANPSHFARLFHRETGLTPSEYRRQR